MEIKTEKDGNITVILPIGRIDTSTAKLFENEIMKVLENNKVIVISFAKIDYISSAGLRIILMTGKKISAIQGKFALIDMAPKIFEVFKMSGFNKIVSIYPTLEEAKESLEN